MCELPAISVVVSVYGNVGEFKETLDSILCQDIDDFEVVVVDDGNFDDDRISLKKICCIDPRVRLIHNTVNKGLTCCLVQGIHEAKGKYIARIDNGDLMVPSGRLRIQSQYLESFGFDIVGGELEVVDVLNGLRFRSLLSKKKMFPSSDSESSCFAHVCVMFKKNVYYDSGGYDEGLRVGQDADLWPRILKFGTGINLSNTFAVAPMKSGSISVKDNNFQIKGKINRLKNSFSDKKTVFCIFSIALEYMKLWLPLRFRVAARYFKNMRFVGFIGYKDRERLSDIRKFYSKYND